MAVMDKSAVAPAFGVVDQVVPEFGAIVAEVQRTPRIRAPDHAQRASRRLGCITHGNAASVATLSGQAVVERPAFIPEVAHEVGPRQSGLGTRRDLPRWPARTRPRAGSHGRAVGGGSGHRHTTPTAPDRLGPIPPVLQLLGAWLAGVATDVAEGVGQRPFIFPADTVCSSKWFHLSHVVAEMSQLSPDSSLAFA